MHNKNKKLQKTLEQAIEAGLQRAGRIKLEKELGISQRDARELAKLLKTADGQNNAPASVSHPSEPDLKVVVTPSFEPRQNATDMTNWASGWELEALPPQVVSTTDNKGNVRTSKVIYDPGVIWPTDYTGPRHHTELFIQARPARPKKWGLLVVSQQAKTPSIGPALMSLYALAAHRSLKLVVLGIEHKSIAPTNKTDEILDWPAAISDYVLTSKAEIGDLVIDAAFPLKPTQTNPLHGINRYCKKRNHIFGSPRQDTCTLVKYKNERQKQAWTTGAISAPNYSRSKAGMLAVEDHVVGGLIVECDFEDRVFIRNIQINPHTGELWDTDVVVENGIVRDADEVKAERQSASVLSVGCVHARWVNKACVRAIWGGKGPTDDIPLVDVIQPREQVIHDVFDAYSVSPHNRKSPFLQLYKRMNGDDDLMSELKLTAGFIESIGGKGRRTWIVDSNHDRHLDRYFTEADWKRDVKNAHTYLKVNLAHVEAIQAGKDFHALSYALKMVNKRVRFELATIDSPLRFIRRYYHEHGDIGTNGSSGSNTNFHSTGNPMSKAHDHTLFKQGDMVSIGCILDPPPHAKGQNNWAHAVGVEHPDGSYQILPLIDGKWRA